MDQETEQVRESARWMATLCGNDLGSPGNAPEVADAWVRWAGADTKRWNVLLATIPETDWEQIAIAALKAGVGGDTRATPPAMHWVDERTVDALWSSAAAIAVNRNAQRCADIVTWLDQALADAPQPGLAGTRTRCDMHRWGEGRTKEYHTAVQRDWTAVAEQLLNGHGGKADAQWLCQHEAVGESAGWEKMWTLERTRPEIMGPGLAGAGAQGAIHDPAPRTATRLAQRLGRWSALIGHRDELAAVLRAEACDWCEEIAQWGYRADGGDQAVTDIVCDTIETIAPKLNDSEQKLGALAAQAITRLGDAGGVIAPSTVAVLVGWGAMTERRHWNAVLRNAPQPQEVLRSALLRSRECDDAVAAQMARAAIAGAWSVLGAAPGTAALGPGTIRKLTRKLRMCIAGTKASARTAGLEELAACAGRGLVEARAPWDWMERSEREGALDAVRAPGYARMLREALASGPDEKNPPDIGQRALEALAHTNDARRIDGLDTLEASLAGDGPVDDQAIGIAAGLLSGNVHGIKPQGDGTKRRAVAQAVFALCARHGDTGAIAGAGAVAAGAGMTAAQMHDVLTQSGIWERLDVRGRSALAQRAAEAVCEASTAGEQ